MELNSQQIMEILPHRHPFLLVDRITDFVPGEYAAGVKNVTATEFWYPGHFPGHPVMPGVLILEAMAQVGAVAVLSLPENKGKIALFGGVKNARFKKEVTPGDTLEITCRMTRSKGGVGMGETEARVGGRLVAKAELLFAVAGEAAAQTENEKEKDESHENPVG